MKWPSEDGLKTQPTCNPASCGLNSADFFGLRQTLNRLKWTFQVLVTHPTAKTSVWCHSCWKPVPFFNRIFQPRTQSLLFPEEAFNRASSKELISGNQGDLRQERLGNPPNLAGLTEVETSCRSFSFCSELLTLPTWKLPALSNLGAPR